jgi:proliferating cell nuclear antigen
MNIQLADATLFRKSIDALKDFLPQAQIQMTTEGLSIRGMDSSHVGFVDYFLSSADCASFRVPNNCVVGVSTAILSKVLGTAGSADTLTLSMDAASEKLHIGLTGEAKTAKFDINTLDIDAESMELPELSYGASIRAKSADFMTAIRDIALFADTIQLSLNDEGFHMRAKGDQGNAELSFEPSDDREMTLEGDSVDVSFGLKYLQTIVKNCGLLSSIMEISFDDGQPLRVVSKFGKESHFIAYLAPKIQD